ncbi:hypothetical protein [Helicobacter cetorum]|uniref:putative barnase/colicin E5 family endoribonuclease n=1 Tax=Helicobacter cetorum TaxID=138563 RepID=UPI0022777B4C|nr:hypothetical protein [Helicobacter cetorum]
MEWGKNYKEFKGDGLGAINKLLETKSGYVEGAFYKQGLGAIDLVWGNKNYGIEHILKKREKDYRHLGETKAKEKLKELLKNIPEVIEKGKKHEDEFNRINIIYNNQKVGINTKVNNKETGRRYIVTSYETREKQ